MYRCRNRYIFVRIQLPLNRKRDQIPLKLFYGTGTAELVIRTEEEFFCKTWLPAILQKT